MNKIYYKIALLFFISVQGFGFSNIPIFVKEVIEIDILGDQCIINGSYYFKNISKEPILNRVLFYPFPVDSNISYPDSIVVFNPHNKQVPYSKTNNGIFFKINITSMSTECYTVKFYQKTTIEKYVYILSTTQFWKRPLSSADFIITLPNNLSMEYISLHYNRIEESKNNKKYFIHRKNFYPTENLIMEWRVKR